MAYTKTVTIVPAVNAATAHTDLPPGRYFVVIITETDCGASDEAAIPLPLAGMFLEIHAQDSYNATGSVTVNPILGRSANPAGLDILIENDTAAATIHNAPSNKAPRYISGSTLYHRSRPTTGSNNSVTTEYLFKRVQ